MENLPKQKYQSEFINTYPAPEDQSAQQQQFIETMSNFPDTDNAVEYNLQNLVRSPESSTGLVLMNPDPETGDNLGETYDEEGNLPVGSLAMVGGLYSLTGAATIREETMDYDSGHSVHEALRHGTYNGQEVFFLERTHMKRDEAGNYTKTKFTLRSLGALTAKEELEEPYHNQLPEIYHIAGRQVYANEIKERGMTSENFREVAYQIAAEEAAKLAKKEQQEATLQGIEEAYDMPAKTGTLDDHEIPAETYKPVSRRRKMAHRVSAMLRKRRNQS